jgi:hypothetical protein
MVVLPRTVYDPTDSATVKGEVHRVSNVRVNWRGPLRSAGVLIVRYHEFGLEQLKDRLVCCWGCRTRLFMG